MCGMKLGVHQVWKCSRITIILSVASMTKQQREALGSTMICYCQRKLAFNQQIRVSVVVVLKGRSTQMPASEVVLVSWVSSLKHFSIICPQPTNCNNCTVYCSKLCVNMLCTVITFYCRWNVEYFLKIVPLLSVHWEATNLKGVLICFGF